MEQTTCPIAGQWRIKQ